MAGSTTIIEVKPDAGVWTLIATGPKNLVIKVLKDCPTVMIYYGPTGLPSSDLNYFPLDWDDVALSIALPATDSVYYKILAGHRSHLAVISQDA